MSTLTVEHPTRPIAWRAVLVLLATMLAHACVLERVDRILVGADAAPEPFVAVTARLLPPPSPQAPPPAPPPPPPRPRPAPAVRPKPPALPAEPVPVPVAEAQPAPAQTDTPSPPEPVEAKPEPEVPAPAEETAQPVAAEPEVFEASGESLLAALAHLPELRAAMPATARYIYRTTHSELRIATGTTVVDWSLADDGQYEMRLATTAVGMTVLELVSQGHLRAFGLAPQRYVESRARRAAEAANFDWEGRRLTFSARPHQRLLADGTQDRVSFQIQLMLLGRARPELFRAGAQVIMSMAGRDDLAVYRFRSAGAASTSTGIGVLDAVRIERMIAHEGEARIDVWLVPGLGWLPVRLRFTDRLGRVTESVLESIPKS